MYKPKNIALLYSSRNDYHVLDEILYKKSFKGVEDIFTMNVDISSTKENKEIGKNILNKYGVIDLNPGVSDVTPMGNCVKLAFDYMDENNLNYDWLGVVQHDVYFPQKDFWYELEKEIDRIDFKTKVGTIGFAVKNLPNLGDLCYGRGNLLGGTIGKREGFLIDLPEDYKIVDYFIVECSWYVFWLINRKLFRKYIEIDTNFILNFWGDQIAHDFMINDVANIVIPRFIVIDDWRYKMNSLGVPHCNKGMNKFYHNDHWKHHEFWNNRYGYKMYYPNKDYVKAEQERMDDFMVYGRKYAGTLVDKIFNLHINDGPKKLGDLDL